ncbi:acetyl-CoA carboxylase carboxyltransferase subunit beta [Candidatus Sumerlaeota bacterium]|nr:acetyl-CoA carboxylase carboxyltransferase subunit beta [Candidatus Sumerlaeota bacterium]
MAWFKKQKYTTLQFSTKKSERIPEGLFVKCESCYAVILASEFEKNLMVCPECGHHHKFPVNKRIALLTDEGSFSKMFEEIRPTDPLGFVDSKKYPDRIKAAQEKSGFSEAVVTGTATINGHPVAIGFMVFDFIGGSMGSVVGERITRLIEYATEHRLPVIMINCSGGARMQEGILSLMQMAKTSGACARHAMAGLPYISVLTDPSTAGVMASYASLGDVCIAEPETLIGFAGPRVIQQTINQILPKDFQQADFVLKHGFLDMVVSRAEMKDTLTKLIEYMEPAPIAETKK